VSLSESAPRKVLREELEGTENDLKKKFQQLIQINRMPQGFTMGFTHLGPRKKDSCERGGGKGEGSLNPN